MEQEFTEELIKYYAELATKNDLWITMDTPPFSGSIIVANKNNQYKIIEDFTIFDYEDGVHLIDKLISQGYFKWCLLEELIN